MIKKYNTSRTFFIHLLVYDLSPMGLGSLVVPFDVFTPIPLFLGVAKVDNLNKTFMISLYYR